jgi:hypothetical protein
MSNGPMISLYDLLPAIYKIDDDEAGGPLKAFLSVIQEQADLLKLNIDQLYADLFIETCAEWVIPYIGDLVGNRPLHEVLRTRRADVARTLYYRRRKGTLPALEELARDVTGWSVRAVPFFESLVWAQNMNHRRNAGNTADIRDLQIMDLFGGPFEKTAHTLDIRQMDAKAGRYHPRRIGFFTWRLNNYHVEAGAAFRASAPHEQGFHFSPHGLRTRLFQRPEDLTVGSLTEERHIRQSIRPAAFFLNPAQFYDTTVTPTVHMGDGISFGPPLNLTPMDLSGGAQPAAGEAGIDTLRGLISFAAGEIPIQTGVAYRDEKPRLAERLAAPKDHIFRFPLLDLDVRCDGGLIPISEFQYMDLNSWARPSAGRVGVDLGLGRLSFAVGEEPQTDVEFRFGTGAFTIAAQADPPNDHGFLLQLPANKSSLRITRDGAPVPPFQLFCMHLRNWDRPPALRVGIDLELGRISFPSGEEPTSAVIVSYDYGFPADLGGGPYDRLAPVKPGETVNTLAAQALRDPSGFIDGGAFLNLAVGIGGFDSINSALNAWRGEGRPNCVITIQDSRTYTEDITLDVADKTLVLQAANRCRPVISGDVLTNGGSGTATLILSGLWLSSTLLADGDLNRLVISHCAIAADRPTSVSVDITNKSVEIDLERSIIGGLTAPPESALTVKDCIARAINCDGVAAIESSTVLGPANLHEISLVSECIFTGSVNVERRQSGCVRYSFLPSASQTPRRYHCQPDLALENIPAAQSPAAEIRVTPVFTSEDYGDEGYAQLSVTCPAQISAGGEDGGEMGAFQFLHQGRREANIHLRLDEYLPFGLRAGIIYVN